MTVAALYVDPTGVYANLEGVEVWDEARDARTYPGPWPVVAHPPCASWSIMGNCRPATRARGDSGTFAAALAAARRFGGVLEQPRHSRAWRTFELPYPSRYGWTQSLTDAGYDTEVDQGRYGHPVYKPTWLYYVGPDPPALLWEDSAAPRGRHGVSHHGGGRASSKRGATRSSTPTAFRDVLLDMVRSAAKREHEDGHRAPPC